MASSFSNVVECIEGHNAGMLVKAVFLPHIPGRTMVEKRQYCSSNLDHIRKLLTYEPRSGSNSYGVVVTGPSSQDSHFGAVYFDPSGWHDMCGHATIFVSSLAVQRKLVETENSQFVTITIDTPAGKVRTAVYLKEGGEIDHVSLENVPSFVLSNHKVELEGYGSIDIPVVFGGNFYAIVDLEEIGLEYSRNILKELVGIAAEVFGKIDQSNIRHPLLADVNGLYGVRFHSRVTNKKGEVYGPMLFGSENRVSIDRSPSGTGSSAHLAYLHFIKKEVELEEEVKFYSAIDSKFVCVAHEEVNVGPHKAIVPEVSTVDKGCFITAYSNYVVDEQDPLGEGFKPIEPL